MIIKSLKFWTLVAGFLAFVIGFYSPNFPFDEVAILSAILFLLSLFGIVPEVRHLGLRSADIYKKKEFWLLVTGLLAFVANFFFPELGITSGILMGVVVFIFGIFGIELELKARGLWR